MRKISLFSLVALLAVSCSQDSQFEGFAGVEQSNDANSAQQISNFITKNVVDAYDGNLLEVADIYAQFARELAARDKSILANALNGVPTAKKAWLKLDFSKMGGEFEASLTDSSWAYTPNEGVLKFVYPHFDFKNRNLQECELVVKAEDENYEFRPNPLLTLQFPQTITDSLFVNGELAGNGIIMSGALGNNSFEVEIEREIADYELYGGIAFSKGNGKILSFDVFEISRNGETFAAFCSEQDTDGGLYYGIKIGEDDENIMFLVSEKDVFELVELLSLNEHLLNGEELDLASISNRINAFNANSALNFEYNGIRDTVEGTVKLILLEPNPVRNTSCIGFDLAFTVNDGSEIILNEPVIEAAIEGVIEATVDMIIACKNEAEHIVYCYISAIREKIEDIRDGIIAFNKAVIEGICDYNEMVINGIINYNQMVKARVQEFERWAAATLSLPYEFFKGLGEYKIAFINGIISQIDSFIGDLDEFLDNYFNRN